MQSSSLLLGNFINEAAHDVHSLSQMLTAAQLPWSRLSRNEKTIWWIQDHIRYVRFQCTSEEVICESEMINYWLKDKKAVVL